MDDPSERNRATNTDLAVMIWVLSALAILAGLLLPHETKPVHASTAKSATVNAKPASG